MMTDYDSSASGYLTDTFEGISQVFTDVEILSTSEVNIVAKAKRYGRWWLLKGLRQEVAQEMGYQQRLRKELEILMQLQHPGVVTAYGLEEVKELGLCIVMEYVDGVTLKEWMQEKPARKEQRRIATELTETVGYVHSCSIVHRDLKPENIIITRNGQNVKLIDFGLADTDSHTILKQPAGTEKYMSPEQMQTAMADVRNDIYSLGVIFSKMNLGNGFSRIISKCLKPIEQRYQNVAALMADIRKKDKSKWNGKIRLAIVAIVALVAIVIAVMQSLKVGELSKIVTASEQRQTTIQTTVTTLTDSLEEMAAAHQSLRDEQLLSDTRQKRVGEAINRGQAAIDQALKNTGIRQHLDTLTDFAYFRPEIFARLNECETAYNQYMADMKGKYDGEEYDEIASALFFYVGNCQKHCVERYIKMKAEHDKTIMQGN
jgi:Kae1-associated kinase Bud32